MRIINTSVLRTQLSGIRHRPGRLVLTGLSVLVAAFVVFGTVLAYQITTNTTLNSFSSTPQATSLVVRQPSDGTVTEGQLAAVRATPGVAEAVGRLEISGSVGTSGAGGQLVVTADPGSGPLSRLQLVTGSYPTKAGEIAVDRRTARRLAVAPGSRLTVRLDGDEAASAVTVTVTGTVDGPAVDGEQAYAPDAVVAALFGETVGYTRVDLRAVDGTSLSALSDRLYQLLNASPDAEISIVDGAGLRTSEARDAVRQFDDIFAIVAMFVAIAVAAAALVATSTFRIVFAQRLRQLALLRTIGATPGQLVRALAVEGLVVGLVAGVMGVLSALGVGLAAPIAARAAGWTIASPGVPVGAAVAVVVGAAMVTLVAVLAPAFAAADVAPLVALRSATTAGGEHRIGPTRLISGVVLAASAAVIVWRIIDNLPELGQTAGNSSSGLFKLVLSGTAAFCALIALGPALIRPVLAATGWPLRLLGPTGRLAVSGIGAAPRRAAAVSVVVALGVALVAGTVVGNASMRAYADQELAMRAPADFAILAEGEPLASEALSGLTEAQSLADVTTFRIANVTFGEIESSAIDLDLEAVPQLRQMRADSGTLSNLEPGHVVLAAWAARSLGVRVGDSTVLRSADRSVTVTVVAILPGDGPLRSAAVVAPADLDALGATTTPNGVLANAAASGDDGVDLARAEIRQLLGADSGAEIAMLVDQREQINDEISGLFLTALGLLALTVLIAVVGVGTTMALSVLERVQEAGLLRALGLGRSGLRLMIGMEASLYGVIGAVLGLLLGVPGAWLAIRVLDLGAPMALPTGQLLALVLTLVATTGLAGLLPARRAARVSPIAALGTPD